MGTTRSSAGISGGLRRHRFPVLALALTGLVGAVGFALVQPKTYRSETKLGAESATGDQRGGAEKIRAIESEVLSRGTMASVKQELGLDIPVEDLLAGADVAFEALEGGRYEITIGYAGRDAEHSKSIVEQLSRGYQSNVYELPVKRQADVTEALDAKASESGDQLAKIQEKLDAFEQANADFLEEGAGRLAKVRQTIEALESEEMAELQRQLDEHRRSIALEKPYKEREYFGFDKEQVATLDRQVEASKAQIQSLMETNGWPDDHPELLQRMDAMRAKEHALDLARNDKQTRVERIPNEMYESLQKSVAELESRLQVAKRKLGAHRMEEQRLLTNAQRAPAMRTQYEQLVAERDAAKQLDDERRGEVAAARVKLEAIRNKRALKFTTVSAPSLPTVPNGAGAPLIALMGLGGGLLAGFVLALGLESTDKSFRRVEAVSAQLGVPTLGAIDAIKTTDDLARERSRSRKHNLVLVALALVACAGLALALTGGDSVVRGLVGGIGG